MIKGPRRKIALLFAVTLAFSTSASAIRTNGESVYSKDVAFLLDEFETKAHELLSQKGIDWKAVRKEFATAAAKVKDDAAHVKLCARLVARLHDGHAALLDVKAKLPEEPPRFGVGLALCEADKRVLVKVAFGPALACGLAPGMEVVSIDGRKAQDWLDAKTAEIADEHGFSTAHAVRYAACHWGLLGQDGKTLSIEFERGTAGTKRVTLTYGKSGGDARYLGSAFPPSGLQPLGKRDSFGKLASGFAYVALGECAAELPSELDTALSKIGDAPGLILDMRANNGGATDHEQVFGRFLAADEKWRQYTGVGSAHFTGPLVVIVDAGTRSTGETVSGMLKEDGRAWMIGASPTAGMSSSKTEVVVPSKLFSVRFSISSNKQRFNAGKGIEGLGVPPNEIVAWDAKLLSAGVDPLIRRAEELLSKGFSKGAVAYAGSPSKPR